MGTLSCRAKFEPVYFSLQKAIRFLTARDGGNADIAGAIYLSAIFFLACHRHPLRAAFFFLEGRYNIATFCINILANDLDATCIPAMLYLRTTDVITIVLRSLTFWLQPVSIFGCFVNNGTSTVVHISSSYLSILAPDRVILAVPIPLTVLLNRVHCPRRFKPLPCRMAGRIRAVEYSVVSVGVFFPLLITIKFEY